MSCGVLWHNLFTLDVHGIRDTLHLKCNGVQRNGTSKRRLKYFYWTSDSNSLAVDAT